MQSTRAYLAQVVPVAVVFEALPLRHFLASYNQAGPVSIRIRIREITRLARIR
jgi:hypothetical protein